MVTRSHEKIPTFCAEAARLPLRDVRRTGRLLLQLRPPIPQAGRPTRRTAQLDPSQLFHALAGGLCLLALQNTGVAVLPSDMTQPAWFIC
jgi:hypothetical protein